jgi:hypothetical protein
VLALGERLVVMVERGLGKPAPFNPCRSLTRRQQEAT